MKQKYKEKLHSLEVKANLFLQGVYRNGNTIIQIVRKMSFSIRSLELEILKIVINIK